jgi:hypothetical protein
MATDRAFVWCQVCKIAELVESINIDNQARPAQATALAPTNQLETLNDEADASTAAHLFCDAQYRDMFQMIPADQRRGNEPAHGVVS